MTTQFLKVGNGFYYTCIVDSIKIDHTDDNFSRKMLVTFPCIYYLAPLVKDTHTKKIHVSAMSDY